MLSNTMFLFGYSCRSFGNLVFHIQVQRENNCLVKEGHDRRMYALLKF